MNDNWIVVLVFAAVINPVAFAVGIATGLFAKRWWQITFAAAITPIVMAFWFRGFPPVDFTTLLMSASVLWAAGAFALRGFLRER